MVILCILLACLIKRVAGLETRARLRGRGRISSSEHDRIQHAERDTLSNVPVIYLLLKSDGNDGLEYV